MKKLIVFILCLLVSITVSPAFAQQPSSNAQIPERNGDYPDPEHPGIRIRVFVHEPRPAKPSTGSTTSPVLVCPSDDESSAVVPPAGWHLPSSWTYTLNTASVPSSVGAANLPAIVSNAFSQWTGVVGAKVNISRTLFDTTINRARFDGVHVIAWGRTSGSALGVTYTWYYTSSHEVAEVDTIMNQKFPWFWNSANPACTDSNSYDAQNILAHELGHWMGLDDTYTPDYVNNTMYGYGSKGETKKDTLTTGDKNGVKVVYGL